MLELKNLTKKYGETVAVNDVSLTIEKGEFFCLLGSSGCGKSTILRMIGGFEKKTSGSIILNGKDLGDLPPYRIDVNTVFQNYALFPHMTVFGNVAYGLKVKRVSTGEIHERVEEALAQVGLTDFGERMPSQLSGGQQQRVALARAIVNRPSLLLLDEPLSALDKRIAEQTRLELVDLQRRLGTTFIYVTHNQTEALVLADRIAVMHAGVIEQCDVPSEIYERPRTHFVADFIGSMNFIEGRVEAANGERCVLRLWDEWTVEVSKAISQAAGEKVLLCMRPEQLRLSLLPPKEYENGVTGHLRRKIYQGDVTTYRMELPGGRLVDVSQDNYLAHMGKEFFEADQDYHILWSKTSGEVIRHE
jgi:spermidine/putrescine transport system ATP-binding protein